MSLTRNKIAEEKINSIIKGPEAWFKKDLFHKICVSDTPHDFQIFPLQKQVV